MNCLIQTDDKTKRILNGVQQIGMELSEVRF